MAKKDKSKGGELEKFPLEYRLKERYRKTASEGIWKGCTLKSKEKLERMYPNYYEFKDAPNPPEPTPNAILNKEE